MRNKKIIQNNLTSWNEFSEYKTIIQTIPDVTYELDRKGRFIFISEAVHNFGYKPCQLLGKHFSVLIHHEDFFKVSRSNVLPRYRGKITGDDKSPKLFDERRTGERMTRNLEARVIMNKKSPKERDRFRYVEIHSSGKWNKMVKSLNRNYRNTLVLRKKTVKNL